jgi:hypothetical protein
MAMSNSPAVSRDSSSGQRKTHQLELAPAIAAHRARAISMSRPVSAPSGPTMENGA